MSEGQPLPRYAARAVANMPRMPVAPPELPPPEPGSDGEEPLAASPPGPSVRVVVRDHTWGVGCLVVALCPGAQHRQSGCGVLARRVLCCGLAVAVDRVAVLQRVWHASVARAEAFGLRQSPYKCVRWGTCARDHCLLWR